MAAKKASPKSTKSAPKKKPAKDLKARKLTEEELTKVSGGMRRLMDQGSKSRQTVCR